MIVIRRQQKQTLSDNLFRRWLVDHLQSHLPERCSELGEGTVSAIEAAMVDARRFGFDADPHIAKFVELTFLFDADFPDQPWAREIVAMQASAGTRMEWLETAAVEQLGRPALLGVD